MKKLHLCTKNKATIMTGKPFLFFDSQASQNKNKSKMVIPRVEPMTFLLQSKSYTTQATNDFLTDVCLGYFYARFKSTKQRNDLYSRTVL